MATVVADADSPGHAAAVKPWSIQLFGALSVRRGTQESSRFRTRMTASLLAYLAYYANRSHPREVLIELFWPEATPSGGRNRLSTALSSLRSQLETGEISTPSVLLADHFAVRLNPSAVTTDVAAFEIALDAVARTASEKERGTLLEQAIGLYQGVLLPGFYDPWIVPEQERLRTRFLEAAHTFGGLCAQAGNYAKALDIAHRAVAADPLREEAHADLVALYAGAGRAGDARRHYDVAVELLRRETGALEGTLLREAVRAISPCLVAPSASPGFKANTSVSPLSLLPRSRTRFFGRDNEVAWLGEILQSGGERLVTLMGPGGVGKTRTALETANTLREAYAGRVWTVGLADVCGEEPVIAALRAAIVSPGVAYSATEDPLARVEGALAEAPSLLLLDNFEHLGEAEALLIARLLDRIPVLACLVTSRRMLRLTGERIVTLAPLPAVPASVSIGVLSKSPSVALFLDRARAARPDFTLTEDNAPAVAGLCERLEGIPLALELAAARAPIFTPAQMLAQMEERFVFLRNRKGDAPERHRSLRAAMDWSYDLLPKGPQRLFTLLSVFRGGWTLDAAAVMVTDGGADREVDAAEDLMVLMESSLVTSAEESGGMRFRMLEMLRQYAEERLQTAGEGEKAEALARHRTVFLSLAEEAEPHLQGTQQRSWLNRLEEEHDNLRAALDQCPPTESLIELRLASALHRFWLIRGHIAEGRRRLNSALAACPDAPAEIRGKAVNGAGILAWSAGDYEAAEHLFKESLTLHRSLGNQGGIARALNNLGLVAQQRGDLAAARSFYEESLTEYRVLQDEARISVTLSNLGTILLHIQDLQAARRVLEESLAIQRRQGDTFSTALALMNLGNVLLQQGETAAAACLLVESLELHRLLDNRSAIATPLLAVVEIAWKAGFDHRATILLGAVEVVSEQSGSALSPVEESDYQNCLNTLRERVEEEVFVELWASGRAMKPPEAMGYALQTLRDIASAAETRVTSAV